MKTILHIFLFIVILLLIGKIVWVSYLIMSRVALFIGIPQYQINWLYGSVIAIFVIAFLMKFIDVRMPD